MAKPKSLTIESLVAVKKKPQDPFAGLVNNDDTNDHDLLNDRQKQRLDLVNKITEDGFYIFQQSFESKSGPLVSIGGREYKLLSSYDYLGLIGHKGIEKAAVDAIYQFGTNSGGSRLLTGTNKLHLALEEQLSGLLGVEAAVTFSSGYQANLAVISSLFDSKDFAFIDSKIHQSTVDACKLAGVSYRRFDHNDPASLERLLKQRGCSNRVVVITEGMYSMDGDICKLREIVHLKNKYDAFLMVDEAHSLGVLGKQGRGIASHFDIAAEEIDILTGSLSKAIPASGGFVAGTKELIAFLQHGSSPYIFSGSLSPCATATAHMALNILRTEPGRHSRLWANTEFFREGLQNLGFNTGFSSTPIIPVILGRDKSALCFARQLFDCGILATPVLFPAVPKNQSMLRLCVTAAYEKSFLDDVLEVFKKLG